MKVKEIIERNLSRAAAGREANKQMHRREDAIGKRIYYGPGIKKKRRAAEKRRLAAIRARLKKYLQKNSQ